jgi:hypothetical protein
MYRFACSTRKHFKPLTLQDLIDFWFSEFLVLVQFGLDKFEQEPVEHLIELVDFRVTGIVGIQYFSE